MPKTSSSPAAVVAAHGRQATSFPLLRQLLAALLFDLGLCYSGRHFQRDRSARARCCNGWRPSWSWMSIDGNLHRVASWRPITFADPRFSWESEPSRIPYHCTQEAIDAALAMGDLTDEQWRDYSTEERLERLRDHTAAVQARLKSWALYSNGGTA